MAFVRRKGNSFYLVHNVRRGEKVQQLHLARLGQRARITDEVVKEVSKKHPFVELNWRALREQCNHSADLADRNSPTVQKLVSSLRTLNLELADVFPPLVQISELPVSRELLVQLRLLQSTIQVKLEQFDRGRGRYGNPHGRVR
ncbi:MAG TPA: hypothetical protein VF749_10345 [Candidatus Acidoferrum sp.]